MGRCKDQEVIKRQIGIFRQVSPELATALEKGLKVKGLKSIDDVQFMGSNNHLGKRLGANGLAVDDPTVTWDNGAPRPHAVAVTA